ncbi:type II secretion system secretin GspD [Luteimonas sp. RD2P54]|uniref:Type II secretion system secretin GspD n=1 Tax=Luteimonas endophytica TaxID=3042023 RepID=A0ABT6J860_9GAMM|nr:type II secretion system secretin GspD [Luteimonas endophytica]MDH5822358.1 type II secretion system secretin GspD [Luteimonas endophytica]
MKPLLPIKAPIAALLATLLAACATVPAPEVRRDGAAGVPAPAGVQAAPLEEDDGLPQAQIRRGTGQVIDQRAAASAPRGIGGTTGSAQFNFEGESVHAVAKAILGDMLGQNYVIAPEVQGTVTVGTPRPVSPAQALSLLEMVLAWNNARMIYSDGRYNIVPAEGAVATGTVAPRTGTATGARGFEVRAVPLRYISATEMEKVLEPYARPDAIVGVDNARNVITVSGSRAELENYLRTIEIFDVDWLAGMSVGVFPIDSGSAAQVVADLEQVFGEDSGSPVSGMFRFMPLEGANAVMVITSQPAYLDEIQRWLERIDSAGGEARLYSYELKYVKAMDLADRLAEVFGAGGGRRGGDGGSASLMPGLQSTQVRGSGVGGRDSSAAIGGDAGNDDRSARGGRSGGRSGGSGSGGQLQLGDSGSGSGSGSVTLEVDGAQVGVSAVEETNTLLVRSTAQAWKSIREVVERLDVMPMQVHIEAQVAEVALTGELSYGVNWFFERAVTDAGLPDAFRRTTWSGLAGNITGTQTGAGPAGLSWTFLGRNAAAIISALDEVTDLRLLQTPSIFVRNNAEAELNVGSRIPISSVTVNPGLGSDNTISQVQYLDTGIILKVRPRVTQDGMVFLDIAQEVSSPGDVPDDNGNVRINTRYMKTEAAVQAGDTVMLAGLITDGSTRGSIGFPGLSRLPVIGGLFGRQSTTNDRTEVIVLLTPTIVRNPMEARRLTDEYGRRFRAMEPLEQQRAEEAARAAGAAAGSE